MRLNLTFLELAIKVFVNGPPAGQQEVSARRPFVFFSLQAEDFPDGILDSRRGPGSPDGPVRHRRATRPSGFTSIT